MGNIQDGKTDLESPCPNQEVHVVENKNDCSATIDKLKSELEVNNVLGIQDGKTDLESPWPNQEVHVVENENDCSAAIDKLKSELELCNVLGIHCEWNRSETGEPSRVAVLQLASVNGVVVLFHLLHLENIPVELEKILKDKDVFKVDSGFYGKRLKNDYKIKVKGTLELPNKWKIKCMEFLNIPLIDSSLLQWTSTKLNERQVNYAAINARTSIEIFKHFAQKYDRNYYVDDVLSAIGKRCKSHNPTKKSQNPKKRYRQRRLAVKIHRTYVSLKNADAGEEILRKLKSHCDEYNILGIDCELDIISPKSDIRTAMLQLASYDGTSFFIRLSGKKLTSFSRQLKEILEDDRIMKIGVSPHHNTNQLEYHGINARSMFDLRYMAKACDMQPDTLAAMFQKLTENESVVTDNDLPTNNAQAAIKLFQAFAKKLQPDHLPEGSVGYARNIVEKYCAPNFNMDYFPMEDKLKIQDTRIIVDVDECLAAVEEIKRHCAEYNVLGLDCEWVRSSRVALLQLATHKGLCILIRLSILKMIPQELKEILKDEKIIKVGKDIFNDAIKLFEQHDAVVAGLLDVGNMAEVCGFRNGGLESMTKAFLNTPKYKTKHITCSDWEKPILTEKQISYAAKDAQAGIELFKFFAEKVDLSFNTGTDYVKRVKHVTDKYFSTLVNSTK